MSWRLPDRVTKVLAVAVLGGTVAATAAYHVGRAKGNPMRLFLDEHGLIRPMSRIDYLKHQIAMEEETLARLEEAGKEEDRAESEAKKQRAEFALAQAEAKAVYTDADVPIDEEDG